MSFQCCFIAKLTRTDCSNTRGTVAGSDGCCRHRCSWGWLGRGPRASCTKQRQSELLLEQLCAAKPGCRGMPWGGDGAPPRGTLHRRLPQPSGAGSLTAPTCGTQRRSCSPHLPAPNTQEPSRANQGTEQWWGGLDLFSQRSRERGRPRQHPRAARAPRPPGHPCPGSRRSNKNRPWSCRDTVKTKPRCTKSGHLRRCKNKTLLL